MGFNESLTPILGEKSTSYPPEYETSPEFMNGKFGECLENDKFLLEQIETLKNKTYVTSGGGSSEYEKATSPSDYTDDALTVRKLRKCSAVGATTGYWASIIGLRAHGGNNCFELAFTNDCKLIFRKQNGTEDTWNDWQQIAITLVHSPTLLNGWTQFSGHQVVKLIRTGNIVNLVGFVNKGTTTGTTKMLGPIPEEFRPKITQVARTAQLDLRVSSDGYLAMQGVYVDNSAYAYNGLCWEV